MPLILLLFLVTLSYASEFPDTFSRVGDPVFSNMKKYQEIKELDIFKDRPELIEAFLLDAKATMQKGFFLDKVKNNPELIVDKDKIKSYAKELRILSNQDENILFELNKDIKSLYEQGKFQSLKKIDEAGFVLSVKIRQAIKDEDKKHKTIELKEKEMKVAKTPPSKQEKNLSATAVLVNTKPLEVEKEVLKVKVEVTPATLLVKQEPIIEKKVISTPIKKNNKSTKLEYYEMSLKNLKDELYALREGSTDNSSQELSELPSENERKMLCLNNITAMNYWMIKVLENKNDSCLLKDSIKQMKSYDKASMSSCGRESMRYIEWHGRIKPYVGKRLFEAEAGCNN